MRLRLGLLSKINFTLLRSNWSGLASRRFLLRAQEREGKYYKRYSKKGGHLIRPEANGIGRDKRDHRGVPRGQEARSGPHPSRGWHESRPRSTRAGRIRAGSSRRTIIELTSIETHASELPEGNAAVEDRYAADSSTEQEKKRGFRLHFRPPRTRVRTNNKTGLIISRQLTETF